MITAPLLDFERIIRDKLAGRAIDLDGAIADLETALRKQDIADKKAVFEMRVSRVSYGTEVYMKSAPIEALMRRLSVGYSIDPAQRERELSAEADEGIYGAEFYKTARIYCLDARASRMVAPHHLGNPPDHGGFNASLLKIVGLGKGVTIPLEFPMNNPGINAMRDNAREKVRALVAEYVRPLTATLTVTAADVAGNVE